MYHMNSDVTIVALCPSLYTVGETKKDLIVQCFLAY